MKIYDCFIFNHEVELLELRLNILNDYVDKFVITEGNVTFRGLPKESYFLKNKERFAQWEDKIILNSITIPECESPWDREIYSRNSMIDLDIFEDGDLILTSDTDEIPNPEVLEHASEWIKDDSHFTFQQSCYAYWVNNLCSDKWFGTRAATYKYIKNVGVDEIREVTEDESKITGSLITNGGWHFTSLGNADHIKQKFKSFSHSEMDVPEVIENISKNLEEGKDVFNRSHITCHRVDIDDSFPQYIIDNQETYSHLIKD